jgi:hypothetical protein
MEVVGQIRQPASIPISSANPLEPLQAPEPVQIQVPQTPNVNLEQAARQASEDRRNLAILQASGQILKGLAGGGRYTPEVDVSYRNLEPMVGSQLQEIRAVDEAKANAAKTLQQQVVAASRQDRVNPQSAVSDVTRKAYAESLRRIGKNSLAESIEKSKLSLDQLEQVFGGLNLQNMETLFETAESRRELAKLKSETKAEEKKEDLSFFEKEELKKTAPLITDYTIKDRPQIVANLEKISGAIEAMEKNKNISGPVVGRTPDFLKQALGNEEAIAVREAMQSAIVETLRPTLGAQFTQVEGERIQNLTFNPNISVEENKKRAELLKKAQQNRIAFGDAYSAHLRSGKTPQSFDFAKYGAQMIGEPASEEIQNINRQTQTTSQRQIRYKGKLYNVAPNGDLTEAK